MSNQTTPLSIVILFLAIGMLASNRANGQTASPDLVFQVQGLT